MPTGASSDRTSAATRVTCTADDVKGDGTVNVSTLTAPRVAATGASVGDTGAQLYLIQYA